MSESELPEGLIESLLKAKSDQVAASWAYSMNNGEDIIWAREGKITPWRTDLDTASEKLRIAKDQVVGEIRRLRAELAKSKLLNRGEPSGLDDYEMAEQD